MNSVTQDEPAHTQSDLRDTLSADVWMIPLFTEQRIVLTITSDDTDAQADLKLRCPHIYDYPFSNDAFISDGEGAYADREIQGPHMSEDLFSRDASNI